MTLYDSETFLIVSVTWLLKFPGLIILKAAWTDLYAARITSALGPVTTAFASDWTTIVWAANAAKPSTWAPNSIFTRSPYLIATDSSSRGELCPHVSLTEIQVGKAIPLKSCFLLKTLLRSSSNDESPNKQRSKILEPTEIFLMSLAKTSRIKEICTICYFSSCLIFLNNSRGA